MGGCSFDCGEGRAEKVVEVIRQFFRFVDRMGSDRDAPARVRFDNVNRVVAAKEGEAVPEE